VFSFGDRIIYMIDGKVEKIESAQDRARNGEAGH